MKLPCVFKSHMGYPIVQVFWMEREEAIETNVKLSTAPSSFPSNTVPIEIVETIPHSMVEQDSKYNYILKIN
jgi:hypothetical protein